MPIFHTPFPWRSFGRDAIYATGFNVLCALAISAVVGLDRDFLPNMLASMWIGTTAFVLIDGGRLLVWGDHQRPNWVGFGAIIAVAAPLSQFGGMMMAHWTLGLGEFPWQAISGPRMLSMALVTILAASAGTILFATHGRAILAEAHAARETARAEAIARQATQAQLQLLQAQIEPHMLFNTLSNVQGLIAIDAERAQHMLDQLIHYLRATLSSSRAGSTTLAQEFALMEAYLGLMSVRMGARLSYALSLPPELRAAVLPPMLLQPLIENAIQHGLEPKIEGGHIAVSAAVAGDLLVLRVADTGLGLASGASRPGTSLGLSNTRERLRAIHGERASLTLTDGSPCGAVAILSLPMTP